MEAVHKKADSISAAITAGKMTFEEAVKNFSDDKASRAKNGELQWFGAGTSLRMIPEFEDAAFALKKDGDISKPIKTQFGWHIIKRLEKKEIPSFADAKADIKKKVESDSRSEEAKTVLVDRIKKENGFVQHPEVKVAFASKVDSSIFKGNWKANSSLRNIRNSV